MVLLNSPRSTAKPSPLACAWLAVRLIACFVIGAPLVTFLLLRLKGFPQFPGSDWINGLPWSYRALWQPALLAGALSAAAVILAVRRTARFHDPFDAGRAISLGGVTGAAAQALGLAAQSWWVYGSQPIHSFWLSTGMLSGFVCGAAVVPLALWRLSHPLDLEQSRGNLAVWLALIVIVFAWAMRMNYRVFAACLLSDDSSVRFTAQSLVFHRSTRPAMLARALAAVLRRGDAERRIRALRTLAVMGPGARTAEKQIRPLLGDPNPEVRQQAGLTLAAITIK